ncbi:chromate transporter [Hylemonella gracilis]|uniref:Chromate transporter n=1 Tax=Hylemonella gracilis ATCC 19624 TaxID=887062 RepID=F3KRR4_9BURK|nr:chromate transporter [Hylemonella gracilis]EGI77515.1 chromate transporter [Hylemonella gracilis ATCC 19624]
MPQGGPPAPVSPQSDAAVGPVSRGQALRYWLRLGFLSFGGPAGQIALMHQDLVVQRRWISEQRFLHALNYCMLLPGPEAQQLATYLGWLMHRSWGGIVAGALFVLPSLVILIALSWLYMAWGQTPWVAGLFHGVKPAITAIVAFAAWRIGARVLYREGRLDLGLTGLAVAAFVAIFVLQLPFPLIVAVAALLGWAAARWGRVSGAGRAARPGVEQGGDSRGDQRRDEGGGPNGAVAQTSAEPAVHAAHAGQTEHAGQEATPSGERPALIDDHTPPPAHARFAWRRLACVLAVGALLWMLPMGLLWGLLGWRHDYTQMGWFFTKAALLTFGGAYAVLPYIHQGAVGHYGWLSNAQMMDGLALGESTPGPLIMVVAFVAFAGGWNQALLGPDALFMAGAVAALLVTWFTFLPSFLFILAGGPLVESTRGRLSFTAPLTAITAAVVGVILNLALFFAVHVIWPQGVGGRVDWLALGLALAAALALWRYRRPVLEVIAVCALLGLLFQFLGGSA